MADEHEPVDPINQKTCILRASIHCQGCKRKVKKILSQLHGVEYVDVDSKQQKVTVIGDVDADTLIKKLAKSGKKAELWPQIYQRKEKLVPANINTGKKKEEEKEKEKEKEKEIESHAEAPTSSDNGRTLEASPEVEAATKNSQGSGAPVKANGGGGGGGDATAVTGPSVKANGDVQEKKLEEESCSVAPGIKEKEAVERSNGGGGGNGGDSGTSVKKKKKKGQSSNPAAPSAHRGGLENREPGPPPGTNESPPRNHYFQPPPSLQPVYAMSYNTAHSSSSYTSSYYSAPPPHAYAYMHGMEPPPLDPEMNPRQPLDSFEIFSDENPNGCFIM